MGSAELQERKTRVVSAGKAPVWIIGACLGLSVALIALALHGWGAAEVRANSGEVALLTAGGVIWVALSLCLFSWFGVSLRDDALERRNPAALLVVCGGVLGVALTFAGGNLGEGHSYRNNFFSAALGTSGLFGLWWLLELGGRVSASVAEERDFASGLRLCGFLLANGLVLGRAVAGDWHSEGATLADFVRDGWPAGVLCVIAIVLERGVRPNRERPFPDGRSCGLVPALAYLGLAAAWLGNVGRWEGMPR
jgi:hypothetical protein